MADEDDVGAAQWVLRQRVKDLKRKKGEEESDDIGKQKKKRKIGKYNAADVWGLRVSHEEDEFEDGVGVIMTLKDQNILDEKGQELAEGEDVLENIDLKEKFARDKRSHDKEKLSRYRGTGMAYDVYEDSTVVKEDGTVERKLLPQYDIDEDKRVEESRGMLIKGGVLEDPKAIERQRASIRAKLSGKGKATSDGKVMYDISGSTIQQASDYFTPNEVGFKSRKKRKGKKRMKKRSESDVEDELIVGGGPAGHKQATLEPMEEGEVRDFGTRKNKQDTSEKEAIEAEAERRRKYREAVAKAEAVNKELFADDDDDTDLAASMARARKAALEHKNTDVKKKPSVLDLVRKVEKKEGEEENKEGLIISETSEFVRAVPDAEEQLEAEQERIKHTELKERQLRLQLGTKEIETQKLEAVDVEEEEGVWNEVKDEKKEEEESEEEIEDDNPIGREKSVASSMGAALDHLRAQGALEPTIDLAGRNRDEKWYPGLEGIDKETTFKTKEKEEKKSDRRPHRYNRREEEQQKFNKELDRFSGVKLEYLDEFGRHMTPKEAFRQISHVFHGKAPGRNKQEKRLKQYYEELKLKKMVPGDTPLQSAEKMRVLQETAGQSFIVLKGPGAVKPLLSDDKLKKGRGSKFII